jgi:hypothetical protein
MRRDVCGRQSFLETACGLLSSTRDEHRFARAIAPSDPSPKFESEFDPNGVQHQSPGSRSAPWEESARVTHEPQRGSTSRYVQPLRGWCDGCACVPGVRCVTPGYVVGPHCGHPNIVHKPQRGSTSKPRVAKRTLGKLFRMHCSVLGIEVRKFIQCPAMVVQPSKFRQKLHTCGSSHAWEEDHICDHGICSSAWSSTRTSDRRR